MTANALTLCCAMTHMGECYCGVQGYKRIFDEAEAKVMWMETLLSMPPPEVDDPSDLPPESLCRCAPYAPPAHPHSSREVSHPCRVRHIQGSKQAFESIMWLLLSA